MKSDGTSNESACGCCQGVQILTPLAVANRPGLGALAYRAGRHSSFLETMKARLSAGEFEALQGLTSREAQDPAIAWLDGWATVAEVLSFYQERIANEGYLRTAVERLSVQELAYLVGYRLRPGVAASVYLAFTLDRGYAAEIPAGTRAQSLPGPGEVAEPFETSGPVQARAEWNVLQPRLTEEHYLTQASLLPHTPIYLAGITTNLHPGEPIMVVFVTVSSPPEPTRHLYRVLSVTPDPAAGRTAITVQPWAASAPAQQAAAARSLQDLALVYDLEAIDDEAQRFGALCPTGRLCASTRDRLVTLWAPIHTVLSERSALRGVVADAASDLEELLGAAGTANGDRAPALAAQVQDVSARLDKVKTLNEANDPIPHDLLEGLFRRAQALIDALRRRPDLDLPSLPDVRDKVAAALDAVQKLPQAAGQLIAGVETLYAGIDLQVRPVRTWLRTLLDELRAAVENLEYEGQAILGPALAVEATPLLVPGVQPLGALKPTGALAELRLDHTRVFGFQSDTLYNLLGVLAPESTAVAYQVLGTETTQELPPDTPVLHSVAAVRVRAPLFGHNIPDQVITPTGAPVDTSPQTLKTAWKSLSLGAATNLKQIALDAVYDKIGPGTYMLVDKPSAGVRPPEAFRVDKVETVSMSALGVTSRVTLLTLDRNWATTPPAGSTTGSDLEDTRVLRGTTVYALAEPLPLAGQPVTAPVEGNVIELDQVYKGLEPGRWLIVTGEQIDRGGVVDGELVRLDTAFHDVQKIDAGVDLPGENRHTFLRLAGSGLAHQYRVDTVTVYGNVVGATHGETRHEVLGSGNGNEALQRLELGHAPLTYVAAPTAAGAESSLEVRVNGVRWHEAEHLAGLGPTDRRFVTHAGDDDEVTVTFGDGEHGARLPTGEENVTAAYRTGIGRGGNVAAGRISLLSTRPLGVKGVVNPLAASGGADREGRDRARRNAPLGVTALDRLVSVQDYADFCRTFAGIGKASAVRLSDGQRQVVHVTIAGADNIPIDVTSDLYRNLLLALRTHGEPYQPFQVAHRDLMLLIIWARVRVLPDYLWSLVEPQVRAALLDALSFERRELGQDVVLSEVLSAVQGVPGVAYADVDYLDAVQEARLKELIKAGQEAEDSGQEVAMSLALALNERIHCRLARRDPASPSSMQPAQVAFLSPEVPLTLRLEEIRA